MIENNLIFKIVSGDDSDVRTRIVKAAIEEFALNSVEGARTRAITSRSNVNLAAISYHFGGKKDLYLLVIRELSEYFNYAMEPYYAKGRAAAEGGDFAGAKTLISEFLFDCIRKFGKVDVVSSLILILAREEIRHSEAFDVLFESVYMKPVEFLAGLLRTASQGRLEEPRALVFAHTLWSCVRTYTSKNDAVLRMHGWMDFGEAQIETLREALNSVVEKTLS